jgi:hypothetical protein
MERSPVFDEEGFLDSTAERYGLPRDDVRAAWDLLGLPPQEPDGRFLALAAFAETFGVNVRELAAFVAETTAGIEFRTTAPTEESRVTDIEASEMEEHLRSLGYID